MASIIVRGLDDHVKQQLASQAKEHGRSMEAEVRAILTKAALRPHIGLALLNVAQDVGGVEGLPIPTRDHVPHPCGVACRHPEADVTWFEDADLVDSDGDDRQYALPLVKRILS